MLTFHAWIQLQKHLSKIGLDKKIQFVVYILVRISSICILLWYSLKLITHNKIYEILFYCENYQVVKCKFYLRSHNGMEYIRDNFNSFILPKRSHIKEQIKQKQNRHIKQSPPNYVSHYLLRCQRMTAFHRTTTEYNLKCTN